MTAADRAALVPSGSLWRRGSHTYRIIEHDACGAILYRNLRAKPGHNGWDTVHAFVGPKAYFRRVDAPSRRGSLRLVWSAPESRP